MKPLAAERAANPTICYFHDIPFIIFRGIEGEYSMGCPVCVAKHREAVRRVRDFFRKWERYGSCNSYWKSRASVLLLPQANHDRGDISSESE